MISRRKFLQQSSVLSASLLINPSEWAKKNKIGVQLYTLRNDMGKDAKGTIQKVAALGYTEIETFGYNNGKYFGMPATEFAAFINSLGLTAPSSHYFPGGFFRQDNWEEKWKPLLNDAKTIGNNYVVVPYLEDNFRKKIDDYKILAQNLNRAGELTKQAGLQLAYHNHDFEFNDLGGGQNGFDVLLKDCDAGLVKYELDLYWAAKAGRNPVSLFKKTPGRFVMWHVKDMDNTEKKFFTEVGNGTIDFKSIFANAKLSGMKHFFVEQDVCPGPPLESIAKSIAYIKKNLVK